MNSQQLNDENPYTPPVSAPEAAPSQPTPKTAGFFHSTISFLCTAVFNPYRNIDRLERAVPPRLH